MHELLKFFSKDESGSVVPIFASAIFPIMFLAGAAIDYSSQSQNVSYVLNVADSALLRVSDQVAVIVDDTDDADEIKTRVKLILDPLLTSSLDNRSDMEFEIDNVSYDKDSYELKVDIDITQDTSFMALAHVDNLESTISTAITLSPPTKTALSVAFVLDKSGSMGWSGRWATLGTAMNSLKEKFKVLDPDKKYIRTGLTMYDSYGYSFYGMKWNMQKIVNKFNTYWPGGGTNSAPAMINAYNYLNRDYEEKKHKKRNDSDVRKVIIFMTDGSNNSVYSDTYTVNTCTAAKAVGIEIYSISFGSYGRGKAMLENCASGPTNFISANNNAQLLDAFDMIGDSIGTEFYLSH